MALLDAMGAGLCVLASDIPENREVVEGAGFTFKAGVQNLSDMLRLLIQNPSLRTRAGRAAQERIRQQYLWPAITRQIETEYCRILGFPEASAHEAKQQKVESETSQVA